MGYLIPKYYFLMGMSENFISAAEAPQYYVCGLHAHDGDDVRRKKIGNLSSLCK
jgi:hypothetical protein